MALVWGFLSLPFSFPPLLPYYPTPTFCLYHLHLLHLFLFSPPPPSKNFHHFCICYIFSFFLPLSTLPHPNPNIFSLCHCSFHFCICCIFSFNSLSTPPSTVIQTFSHLSLSLQWGWGWFQLGWCGLDEGAFWPQLLQGTHQD